MSKGNKCFAYIENHATVQVPIMDNINVKLQEVAVLNIRQTRDNWSYNRKGDITEENTEQ
jgi:hypothetical protein